MTSGLPVMVVGGRTAIAAPMSCARAASCASPCCCCPDLVWSPTTLSGGGMWSAQLRSPSPHAAASLPTQPATGHGCAALPDKQALFLVAFPICASSNGAPQASQLHPAAATPSSCCCRCCCKCSWNAKPASTAPCWTAQQDSSSPAGRNAFPLPKEEEGKPSSGLLEDRLMDVPPPSPPPPTNAQQRYGSQPPPPHLSATPGGAPGGATSDVDVDLSRVRDALRTLRTSGYYYEGLSWEEAGRLLRGRPVGTFLVRDSSDNRFLFALSVQTERGPTSVRIHYRRGQFRLDCEDALAAGMPWFSCVASLVEHYVRLSRTAKGQMCVWLDGHGRRDLPIMLTRPLYREPASLQHLCRIALNRSAGEVASAACRTVEPLPAALKDYLRDYPHLH